MELNADQSQIRSALKDVVCADPDVVFAVVFGSQLSGTATRSSDFDIAVKFTADCSERDRFKKRCVLSGELQHEEFPFIDVSDIDSLPLDVAHDAANGACSVAMNGLLSSSRQTLRRNLTSNVRRFASTSARSSIG
jgi:predicted nucleotidyltransferase